MNIIGNGAKHLKNTMEKEKLPWRSFADEGPISQGRIATSWNLTSTPTFYVIDAKGVIRNKWVGSPGPHAIDKALEKLIDEAEGEKKSDPPGRLSSVMLGRLSLPFRPISMGSFKRSVIQPEGPAHLGTGCPTLRGISDHAGLGQRCAGLLRAGRPELV